MSEAARSLASIALLLGRIFAAVWLFSHGLPHRDHFARRSAQLAAATVAMIAVFWAVAAGIGPISELAVSLVQLAVFSLILAACVAAICYLCHASLWTALFCATAGYTIQNLATGTTELAAGLERAAGVDPAATLPWLLSSLAPAAAIYGAAWLLVVKRIDREGLLAMEEHSMLAMMPVVSIVIIGFDLVIKALDASGTSLATVALLRLFHGLACVFVLWMSYELLYRRQLSQEMETAQRLLAERERQFRLSEQNIEAINIKCHDIRHQIRSLGAGGAAVDAAVLDDLAREVSIYDSRVKTGNNALDTILTEKSLLAESGGVTLTCIADGSALAHMADADIYALFGNALDNALEAAGGLESDAERSISLVVRQTMGSASVHVENYFAGGREFEDGLPQTTKGDRANHGFGTRSMRQICERYGGTLTLSAHGNVFCLDALIPLA